MKSDDDTKATTRRRLKIFQKLIVATGGCIIAMAMSADMLGFGQAGSFGTGQLLLALAGIGLLLTGFLGKKIVGFYRGMAVFLCNTLVLLGCLELGAIIISRSYQEVKSTGIQRLPYYAAQDWTRVYWEEARRAETYRYKPYVLWRHLPFVGETVNISQEGIRRTPGAECGTNAYKVFTFGGSTMLGWGSPDWGTIAAYLQEGLDERIDRPVCVVNLSEDAFVSTQSLISLILQLQSGNVPDLVIFYDGVNDVLAAYESGQPGVHPQLAKMAAKFEEKENLLAKWFKKSRQYALVENLVARLDRGGRKSGLKHLNYQDIRIDRYDLADLVAEVYLSNYKVVGALALEYGFEYCFFWQPHLGIGEKSLTEEERNMRSRMDPAWTNLVHAIYEAVSSAAPHYENLWYLAHVFDEEGQQIWIDEWGHVTPVGNRLVAQEMLGMIEKRLLEE